MPGPVFLEGETVCLRTIEEEDLDFLQEGVNDRRVRRGVGITQPLNRQQEEEYFEELVCSDDQLHLLATVDGDPVGTVSYPRLVPENRLAELGYWMDPDHQREGYGTEAVEMLVGHGFAELGLHRVAARVFGFNDASRGLLEKVGFTQEGQHRDVRYLDGEWHDEYWYSVLEDEWRGRTIQ